MTAVGWALVLARGVATAARVEQQFIRNVGVVAHIDAGKTTVTERLLHLVGATPAPGDVDHGDTVTDFMQIERQRGITVMSAAVTFAWRRHRLNLIDTPGHVDFTVEVERCLRVLDGAVVVLDASAGVQAQTATVWRQAQKYSVPAVVFLNKMDKPAASFDASVESVRARLSIEPAPLQLPRFDDDGRFCGVVDLISCVEYHWPDDGHARQFLRRPVAPESAVGVKCAAARESLLDTLAALDDPFAECLLSSADPPLQSDVVAAIKQGAVVLRRATEATRLQAADTRSKHRAAAVRQCIPSRCRRAHSRSRRRLPAEPARETARVSAPLQAGRLVRARLQSDARRAQQPALLCARLQWRFSAIGRLLQRESAQEREGTGPFRRARRRTAGERRRRRRSSTARLPAADVVSAGNICVASGLKHAFTGDTLVQSERCAREATASCFGPPPEQDDGKGPELLLAGIEPPEPVYFCSIESPSTRQQEKFDEALERLAREDPSLRIRQDKELMQTVIETVGELHLEIVRDRLKRDWGLDVFLGPLQISYKESPQTEVEHSLSLEERHKKRRQTVTVAFHVAPNPNGGAYKGMRIKRTKGEELANTRGDWLRIVRQGVANACLSGPLLGYGVADATVTLTALEATFGVSEPLLSACANQCVTEALVRAAVTLLEPVMHVVVQVLPGGDAEAVRSRLLHELTRRRARPTRIAETSIEALTPLSEMAGLAGAVRSATSGYGTLHTHLSGYQSISEQHQQLLIRQSRGQA